jgi:hypothetical protein
MNTRHFTVKGAIDCFFSPASGAVFENMAGIEVQLWHKGPIEDIFIGTGFTDSNGEFIVEANFESPAPFIIDGQIKDVYLKPYYGGELLSPMEYDEDALAYFDRLSPEPSSAYKAAINRLVYELKQSNIWDKLDRFFIHATEYQQHAKVSLFAPSSDLITEMGSPAWTAGQGYTGNGSSMYLNTNFNPSASLNFTINSAMLGVYCRTNTTAGTFVEIGSTDGSNDAWIAVKYPLSSNSAIFRINNAASLVTANTDARGFFSVIRNGLTNAKGYKNGSQIVSDTTAAVNVPNENIYVLARNDSGAAAYFTDRQIALTVIGSGDIDQSLLYNSIQEFAERLGFNI